MHVFTHTNSVYRSNWDKTNQTACFMTVETERAMKVRCGREGYKSPATVLARRARKRLRGNGYSVMSGCPLIPECHREPRKQMEGQTCCCFAFARSGCTVWLYALSGSGRRVGPCKESMTAEDFFSTPGLVSCCFVPLLSLADLKQCFLVNRTLHRLCYSRLLSFSFIESQLLYANIRADIPTDDSRDPMNPTVRLLPWQHSKSLYMLRANSSVDKLYAFLQELTDFCPPISGTSLQIWKFFRFALTQPLFRNQVFAVRIMYDQDVNTDCVIVIHPKQSSPKLQAPDGIFRPIMFSIQSVFTQGRKAVHTHILSRLVQQGVSTSPFNFGNEKGVSFSRTRG